MTSRGHRFVAILLLALAGAAIGQEKPVETAPQPPARRLLIELTASPRMAGTSGSLRTARWIAGQLEQAGWSVEIDEREVLLSLPRRLGFAIFDDAAAQRPCFERVDRFDPDAIPPGDVPHFNAWSASGTVRGPVVDVGRGLRADYERLLEQGVEVRGAIALARYRGAFRGVKVDLAAEHGCIGVLLFHDPADDGAGKGPTWPEGPWKPDWVAERGSIAPVARAPGDPTTPGFASPHPGDSVQRLSLDEAAAHLPKIPCLPIGARDAQAIIARLAPAPDSDEEGPPPGAEPPKPPIATGPTGPGPVEVELAIDQPRELRTTRSVVATLPGVDEKLVIAGNHRDAWVRGANDAGSGTVSLLRAAQLLGEKARGGWKPLHTLVLGFWDGEEFGLIGSTEWGEANADRLRRDGLLYVNADAAVSGTKFSASGTPGLLGILRSALARVPAPASEDANAPRTLEEQWVKSAEDGEPRLSLPGSGSDFAVFLHHLSLPVLDIGFGGNSGGQYHTHFDDFAMVERFLDPGFVGHELAGAFLAELLATCAGEDRAGFDESEAALAMAKMVRKAGAEESAWLGAERAERLASAFEALAPPPELRRTPQELEVLTGARFYAALEAPEGLVGREWFKNRLWAPGLETGYSSETLPGLRAAASRGEAELERELDALIATLEQRRLASGIQAPRVANGQ
jgi:N-acetylated-alpha-linked acidic dipeptidase